MTWAIFRAAFLEKYFPAYVYNKKEIEFLNLRHDEDRHAIFLMLVNKFHIYDEDRHARFAYYISVSDTKKGNQNREKPYVFQMANECKSVGVVCYNYGETGHISTNCQKPKKTQDVKVGGKVFALSGAKASKSDNLTRGATHYFISVDCLKILNLIVSPMGGGSKTSMVNLPVVKEFPEAFPKDITDLPLEREVEFFIDLVSAYIDGTL
ncbi:uncharacterized protein LOC127136709 [Lathyrus oleraceus]|uniref:uncharacterized protein LOC127136709 n=1 Tax=Pisum sativum TaxID=3888 RepID=UPI0021D121D8|nr:uncharacterized protein LOC127136709 [Pisum sativum]